MHQLLFVFVFYSNFFLLYYCFVQGAKRRTKPPSLPTSTPLRLPYLLLEECSRELTMSWFMEVRTYSTKQLVFIAAYFCIPFQHTYHKFISSPFAMPGVVFCIIRPPGHHSTIKEMMGFCLLNNLAIGAAYAVITCCICRKHLGPALE